MSTLNNFDIAVLIIIGVTGLVGLASGLIRSIFSVAVALVAMGVAVVYAPMVQPYVSGLIPEGWARSLAAPLLTFLIVALILGLIVNIVLTLALGTSISFGDRVAGLLVGLVRGALIAVFLVVLIDRLVPAGSEPSWLQGSQARAQLSPWGQRAVSALPTRIAWALETLSTNLR